LQFGPGAAREEAQVTVSVHNDAGIPQGVMLQAELDAHAYSGNPELKSLVELPSAGGEKDQDK